MTVSTSSSVYTSTHTATYLSDVIVGAIADILALLGIAPAGSIRWDEDEAAFTAWIREQSLETVILECRRPDGGTRPIFEFPITYRNGEAVFEDSRASWARAQAKISSVPAGTTYKLVCRFRSARTPQAGWGPGVRASTSGLRATSFGTLADAPHASASVRYLR